jgi:hypothetical protein
MRRFTRDRDGTALVLNLGMIVFAVWSVAFVISPAV